MTFITYFSWPSHGQELTVGLIPAESNEEMIAAFEPMRIYLEDCLDEIVTVYTATDYTGIIEAMRKASQHKGKKIKFVRRKG